MILLDDAQSTASIPTSRLYQHPIARWCIESQKTSVEDELAARQCLKEISEALARGEYVVAAFAYELGRQLQNLPWRPSNHPLIQAWSFTSYKALSKNEVDDFVSKSIENLPPDSRSAGVLNLKTSIDKHHFSKDIARIQEYIRNGDTYQINHTYRVTGELYGAPLALYKRLRERQPGRFGAFIEDNSCCILSQSPELFIQRTGDTLKTMPMKGTASALSDTPSHLSQDPKNQAENVMIVDLLRNDLSKLCLTGTVIVPELFQVSRHGDVLQMTSTVEAKAKPNLSFLDVLTAVFPCGSVTGAPKKRSMQIIQDLEPLDRGYYCGALGWLDPQGEFAFSVPIRTIEADRNLHSHSTAFVLGIGAGITSDSDSKQEWEECLIKSAFLTALPSAVGLFETILIKNGQAQNILSHLDRMKLSAAKLRIPFDIEKAQELIQANIQGIDLHSSYRLRLDLDCQGILHINTTPLDSISKNVKIFWAKDLFSNPEESVMFSGNALLKHKTTCRHTYDHAWQVAASKGGFDAIFINEKGFVTEGGRSSIFIKKTGSIQWLTPPINAGVLPGIMRAEVLNDPQWNARESNLTVEDVLVADEIMLTNSLRGFMTAHF